MVVVKLFNQNISDNWVAEISRELVIDGGLFGQTLINPLPGFVGNDTDGFWTGTRQSSPFYNVNDTTGFTIEVINSGVTVFTGSILSIVPGENFTAQVNLQSAFQPILANGSSYESLSAQETPATAARNILEILGIPYDYGSFAEAESYYSDNGIYVYVNPQINGETPVPATNSLTVLSRLCELGCARLYLGSNGSLFFDAFNPDQEPLPSLYTFTDNLMLTTPNRDSLYFPHPTGTLLEKDLHTGVTVVWAGYPATVSGSETGLVKALTGAADEVVQILSAQGAERIGNAWLEYLNRPQIQYKWVGPASVGAEMYVGAPITIDYSAWGGPRNARITSVRAADRVASYFTGVGDLLGYSL